MTALDGFGIIAQEGERDAQDRYDTLIGCIQETILCILRLAHLMRRGAAQGRNALSADMVQNIIVARCLTVWRSYGRDHDTNDTQGYDEDAIRQALGILSTTSKKLNYAAWLLMRTQESITGLHDHYNYYPSIYGDMAEATTHRDLTQELVELHHTTLARHTGIIEYSATAE